jgi:hypothetical protein
MELKWPETLIIHGIEYRRRLETNPDATWELTYKCINVPVLPGISGKVSGIAPMSKEELEYTIQAYKQALMSTWGSFILFQQQMTEGTMDALKDDNLSN